MSMPAGWYHDGSGRQRWWDGARWTDDYAPDLDADPARSTPSAPGATTPMTSAVPRRVVPVLGFVGLGLAVLGTVLACIPVTFGVGVVVLLAGFVVSLVGLFKKGSVKWPSIVGMILSVVGGVIGAVVLVVSLLASIPGPVDPPLPTDSPSTSQQPSDEPTTDVSEGRPSPEEIGEGLAVLARAGGITTYDDMPEFYPCAGQHLYDSDVSDEPLQLIADGQDVTGPEREAVGQAISAATFACDPQP